MLAPLLSLLLIQAPSPALHAASESVVIAPSAAAADIDTLGVRISSPQGVLWQGSLRVSQNSGANYSQNSSQASPSACPPNSPYDRSERNNINFNVYVNNSGELGRIYRVDASWQRAAEDSGCTERGTRTVSVTKALTLAPGETGVVEGDAGLRVEVARGR